jgi:RNA polymerase sigma factor (TIGR02999 family)
MSEILNPQITQILSNNINSKETLNQVFELMYPEIKKIANSQLYKLNTGQTITPTVLVNECYLKLHKPDNLSITNRKHFICTVAKCMRQFLVDKVRSNNRHKRAGQKVDDSLTQMIGSDDIDFQLMEINEILTKLEKIDTDLAEIVELRFFSGNSLIEIAEIQQVSKRTIIRKWNMAKSFISALSEK